MRTAGAAPVWPGCSRCTAALRWSSWPPSWRISGAAARTAVTHPETPVGLLTHRRHPLPPGRLTSPVTLPLLHSPVTVPWPLLPLDSPVTVPQPRLHPWLTSLANNISLTAIDISYGG